MNTIPLNYAIFTTTRGHFNRHDIYKQTVDDLGEYSGLFRNRIANVKISSDSQEFAAVMEKFFKDRNFTLYTRNGDWKHNDQSHQTGYLHDLTRVFTQDSVNEVPYTMVTEDDFLIRAHKFDLEYWCFKAISILEKDPNITQVRIPRFQNEFDRINGLKAKHNLDVRAEHTNDPQYFRCGDWSNNVYFARTRDLRNALLMMNSNPHLFGQHSEHSMSKAMKYFSLSEVPFAILEPSMISCYHRGTVAGQEDDVNQAILAT